MRGGGCRTGGALGGERGPQATGFVDAVVSAGLGGMRPAESSAAPAVDLQGIHRATARDYSIDNSRKLQTCFTMGSKREA